MALITYKAALEHLKQPTTGVDRADIERKMETATAIVIGYLEMSDHAWTDATSPDEDADFAVVQAAILEVLSNLFADRGDAEKPTVGPITPRVENMLKLLRDPSLA